MQYFISRCHEERHRLKFEVYVTDLLKALGETQGVSINDRFVDILYRVEDTRSGDEIVADIFVRAGLKFKEN